MQNNPIINDGLNQLHQPSGMPVPNQPLIDIHPTGQPGNIVINMNQGMNQGVMNPVNHVNQPIMDDGNLNENSAIQENQTVDNIDLNEDTKTPSPSPQDSSSFDQEIEPLQESDMISEENSIPKIKYIDDDLLSKNLNLYMNTERIPIYNISFCIYIINTDCFIEGFEEKDDSIKFHDTQYIYNNFQPFLQFVFEKKETQYEFPTTQYECPQFSEKMTDIENDDKSQEQIHFETFCFNYLSQFLEYNTDIINVFHKEIMDIEGIYKGFIQDSENKNNITVVLDFTKIIHRLKKQYITAIIHEIIYKKTILSFPINPSVIEFFESNDYLIPIYLENSSKMGGSSVYNQSSLIETNYDDGDDNDYDNDENPSIIDQNKKEVLYPFQLYLCKYENGEYYNIKKNEPVNYQTIEHNLFNEIYLFSTETIFEDDNEQYKRFACFLVKDKYYKKDIIELTEEEKKTDNDDNLTASTFYFHENETQFWGIKNISHFIEYS